MQNIVYSKIELAERMKEMENECDAESRFGNKGKNHIHKR